MKAFLIKVRTHLGGHKLLYSILGILVVGAVVAFLVFRPSRKGETEVAEDSSAETTTPPKETSKAAPKATAKKTPVPVPVTTTETADEITILAPVVDQQDGTTTIGTNSPDLQAVVKAVEAGLAANKQAKKVTVVVPVLRQSVTGKDVTVNQRIGVYLGPGVDIIDARAGLVIPGPLLHTNDVAWHHQEISADFGNRMFGTPPPK